MDSDLNSLEMMSKEELLEFAKKIISSGFKVVWRKLTSELSDIQYIEVKF